VGNAHLFILNFEILSHLDFRQEIVFPSLDKYLQVAYTQYIFEYYLHTALTQNITKLGAIPFGK